MKDDNWMPLSELMQCSEVINKNVVYYFLKCLSFCFTYYIHIYIIYIYHAVHSEQLHDIHFKLRIQFKEVTQNQ